MTRVNPEIGEHDLSFDILRRLFDNGSRVTLFMRHAKRHPIDPEDPQWGAGALLTDTGIAQAYALGKALSYFKTFSLVSSPVERCMQTCRYFAEGAGMSSPIQVVANKLLGDPGIYFDGTGRSDIEMRRVGYMAFTFDYIHRGIGIGMRPLAEASDQLLLELRRSMGQGLNICVTHDLFVAVLMDYLKLKVVSPDNWINYLEGVAMVVDPRGKVSYAVFNPLLELQIA